MIFEKWAAITGDKSLSCGQCAAICPTGAVKVSALDSELSNFKTFQARQSWLPFGEGDIGALVNLMQSRRSCRKFKEKSVPGNVLDDLVKVGISAPSGTNCQQWAFTILPDRGAVLDFAHMIGDFYLDLNRTAEKTWLRKSLKFFGKNELEQYFQEYYQTVKEGLETWEKEGKDLLLHGAPAAIVVSSKVEASCPAEDALLATQNILLAAHVLGLGTCLIGFAIEAMRRKRKILRRIGIPKDEEAYAVIALGYPGVKYQRLTGRKKVLVRNFSGERDHYGRDG